MEKLSLSASCPVILTRPCLSAGCRVTGVEFKECGTVWADQVNHTSAALIIHTICRWCSIFFPPRHIVSPAVRLLYLLSILRGGKSFKRGSHICQLCISENNSIIKIPWAKRGNHFKLSLMHTGTFSFSLLWLVLWSPYFVLSSTVTVTHKCKPAFKKRLQKKDPRMNEMLFNLYIFKINLFSKVYLFIYLFNHIEIYCRQFSWNIYSHEWLGEIMANQEGALVTWPERSNRKSGLICLWMLVVHGFKGDFFIFIIHISLHCLQFFTVYIRTCGIWWILWPGRKSQSKRGHC